MKIFSVFIVLLITVFLSSVEPSFANWIDPRHPGFSSPYRSMDPAFFPRCPRPRGEVKAFYSEGTHAIAGKDETVEGADIVFDQGNNNAVQCYCPVHGMNGIQTNWLHAANVSSQWKEHAVHDGWMKIPDGTSWGLSAGPYFAKNSDFLCIRPLSQPYENKSTSLYQYLPLFTSN